jgi:DNA-binding SARP family transcriptional activator
MLPLVREVSEGSSVGLDYRVLGPLRAMRDDVAVGLGGPRQRRLLLVLLGRERRQHPSR